MTIFAPTPANIDAAARMIRDGGLIGMPTETVYGLAADATQGRAVAAIYEAKGRPRFNPLIVHVGSVAQAAELAELGPLARCLAAAFWPGPLTLVARARAGSRIHDLATAGLATVAVRMPAHPVARALIEAAGCPLAAPSANKSGRISPTTAQHVADEFGRELAMILDGGMCERGLESTIVACGAAPANRHASGDGLTLLRPGALAAADIEAACGQRLARRASDPNAPTAPGQLLSHYAPRAAVRLNATDVRAGEAFLAFGPDVPDARAAAMLLNLSAAGDLVEAAQALFAGLRTLDASGAHTIAVMPVPGHGLGEAINDRLMRAAVAR